MLTAVRTVMDTWVEIDPKQMETEVPSKVALTLLEDDTVSLNGYPVGSGGLEDFNKIKAALKDGRYKLKILFGDGLELEIKE